MLAGIQMLLAATITSAWALSGCRTTPNLPSDDPTPSFLDHQQAAFDSMRRHRSFQTPDHAAEVAWNAPRQWQPTGAGVGDRPGKGVLLVHGLGDSPWSFNDVGNRLAAEGFLVRTVLLPGHGTRPDDLLNVDVDDWRHVVRQQATALERDVDGPIYLGGFSTGANLVLELAYQRPGFAGLLLFSPGLRTSVPLGWIAPLAAKVIPWPSTPDTLSSPQNAVRYLATPTNGFAQFYWSSRAVQRLLDAKPYRKPVFMVVAQHDSVLDTNFLLSVFHRRFVHPGSRLVWYGTTPAAPGDTSRILVRTDRLPHERISQFSHMGVLFSPDNPLYGRNATLRVCANGQPAEEFVACEQGTGVWYSDWGYREAGKVHARLTYNPYFEWQNKVMSEVLASAADDPAR